MKSKALTIVLAILFTNTTYAGYNNNIVGEVSDVATYTSGLVLFRLANQPAAHPGCNPTYFALDNTIASPAFNRMYSRLLSANATKMPINIGYDDAGDCAGSYIRVHRIG